MDAPTFIAIVRERAGKGQIIYTNHASERMSQRDISRTMVMGCLKQGTATAPPRHDTDAGGEKCKLTHYMGGVNYEVVVALHDSIPDAVIVTVINKEDGYV
ncbi:MAG: DUF4258 domain-containing protein [Laribacter sp.]|nr:DUF4258 domain-containing protein [Laribacter sp.]